MVFDTEKLDTITVRELGVLLMLYDKSLDKSSIVLQVKDTDIEDFLDFLERKKCIMSTIYATDFNIKPPYQHRSWALLEKGKQLLANNCVQEEKNAKALSKQEIKKRCDALAPKLMEIYPEGKKPGTSLKWRGYLQGVSEKLQKLILNGNVFTDEEAIEATKEYVRGYNGIYTTMRVLPYFLSKNEIVGGEVKKSCDFMSYVEDLRNKSSHTYNSEDWSVDLV